MSAKDINRQLFIRTIAVIGETGLSHLNDAKVAVFGLGGVGAACAEALARCGIGHITLVDYDRVELSNINRQLIALHSTLGLLKTDVCEARLLDINPDLDIKKYPLFYGPDTEHEVDLSMMDGVADCVDTLSAKILLAKKARDEGFYLVSAMGAGKRLNPGRLRLADIYQTSVCPLARRMRKACRDEGIKALRVVYSDEEPIVPPELPEGGHPVLGSVSFVTPVAGYLIAGDIIRHLLGIQ